jgi:hypothetical protein
MSRTRLTTRTAADMKSKPGTQVEDKGSGIDNDTAKMNNPEHEKNDPSVSEYAKGDPSAWAEDVNKNNPAKDDQKREETGHAPLLDKHAAEDAIASARRLEGKAVKAIIASQRMLPGATEEVISKQASILMHLPEEGLNATLTHQEGLAHMIAKAADDSSEESKEEDKKEKEEGEEKEETKDASAEEKVEDKKEEETKDANAIIAKLAAEVEDLKKKLQGDEKSGKDAAASVEDKKEEKEEAKEETKEASDSSLLDQIFSGVMAPTIKKGASKLSGMVKKEASTSASNDLSGLWAGAPDVSDVFN